MHKITGAVIGAAMSSLLLTAPVQAFFFQPKVPGVVTISNDMGGSVLEYGLRMKRMERSGDVVRFAGGCYSACTLYLGLPKRQTCIAPGTRFGFHLPLRTGPRGIRVATSFMLNTYPQWVRNWIQKNGGLTSHIKTMSYEYARQHLPTCQSWQEARLLSERPRR